MFDISCKLWLPLLIVLGFATRWMLWHKNKNARKFCDPIFWLKNRLRVLLNLISCAFTNGTATYKLNYDFFPKIRMSDFWLMSLLLFAKTAYMYAKCMRDVKRYFIETFDVMCGDDEAIFMLLIHWRFTMLYAHLCVCSITLSLHWNFMIFVFNKHYVYFCLSVYSNPIVPYSFGVTWCVEKKKGVRDSENILFR